MGPFSPPQSQLHICTVSVTSPHLLFAPSPFSVHSHSSPLASRLSYRVFFFPHPIFPPHFLKLNASRKTIRALCQRLNTVFIDRSQSTSLPQHPLLTQTTYHFSPSTCLLSKIMRPMATSSLMARTTSTSTTRDDLDLMANLSQRPKKSMLSRSSRSVPLFPPRKLVSSLARAARMSRISVTRLESRLVLARSSRVFMTVS